MSSRRSRSGGISIGNTRQPVEKILAKLIVADHAFQIPMCGRNQTNINVDGSEYFRGVRTPAPAGHAEALAANP